MWRIGMIGAGHFAQAHIEALRNFPARARLVCYSRSEREKPFPEADALGASPMTSEELVCCDDIDAVIICATNNLHRRFAEAALRAGKHVFCEKPLALTVADAGAVLEAAQSSGKFLMVGHLTRHVPVYVMVAEILAEGRLGKPFALYANRMHCGGGRSWRFDPEIGGGVVFDLLIHDLDLLNWYAGPPQSVIARGRKHPQGGYEYAAATFTYADGAIALAEGGFVFRPPAGLRAMLRIVCERGHIEVLTHETEAPIRVFEEGKPEQRLPITTEKLHAHGLVSEYAEFLDALDGNIAGRLRSADARLAVACAAALIEAADTGTRVAVG